MKRLFFLLVILTIVSACRKDEPVDTNNGNQNEVPVGTLNLGNMINADFQGRVIDENNNPVADVLIKIDTKTTYTDDNGLFVIKNANVNEKLAYIKATKQGYFPGSRSVLPIAGKSNSIIIQLLTLEVSGTIASGTNATVNTNDGASIDFEGNFVDESGNPYNGSVTVAAKYLPPLSPETFQQMPGMLYAQNENGQAGVLVTYGMIVVELFGSTGQSLNLAQGSTATLHMPVDPQQLDGAPTTIPLWFFDEVTGYWIEEGFATLINGEYVGEVSHFTFWNCDVFFESCTFEGLVTDSDGNPVGNAVVEITSGGMTANGMTNSDGTFSTFLNANEAATIQISYGCLSASTNYVVGPFATGSANQETFVINIINDVIALTGELVNCDNQPVTNGDIYILNDGFYYSGHVTDGIIEMNIPYCSSITSAMVYIYDYDQNFLDWNGIPVSINYPATDLGQLVICDTTDGITVDDTENAEILDIHIDGQPVYLDIDVNFEFIDSTAAYDWIIYSPADTYYLFVGTEIESAGTYPGTGWSPQIPGELVFLNLYHINESSVMDLSSEVITFEGSGGQIYFTISGTYTDSFGLSHYVFADVMANIP